MSFPIECDKLFRKRRSAVVKIVLASAVLVMVVVSCAFSSPAATPFPTQTPLPALDPNVPHVELTIKNFQHKSVEIEVGTVITWANNDRTPHTITHYPGDSGIERQFDSNRVEADTTFRYTFDKVGAFDYYCKLHPVNMRSVVTVVEASGS